MCVYVCMCFEVCACVQECEGDLARLNLAIVKINNQGDFLRGVACHLRIIIYIYVCVGGLDDRSA
jgi:hypothetical protein